MDYSKIDPKKRPDGWMFNAQANQLVMHPDGKPWRAQCTAEPRCAFAKGEFFAEGRFERGMRGKPKDYGAIFPFVCVHRSENGFNRVCAGWHKKYGKKWAAKQEASNEDTTPRSSD